MVAWEKQIEERSVPEWREKYVAYARLKRQLEKLEKLVTAGSEDGGGMTRSFTRKALESDTEGSPPLRSIDVEEPLIGKEAELQLQQEHFLEAVYDELHRVGNWYQDKVTALEARVRTLASSSEEPAGAAALRSCTGTKEDGNEEIAHLHLQAVRLTEFVLLNVEALRKIVKKMDKQCKTSYQKGFVEKHLKRSPLATNSQHPFNGERARACRRELEQLVSFDKLQEMRNRAMEAGGVGLSKMPLSKSMTTVSIVVAMLAVCLARAKLPGAPRAQRCVGLLAFTVTMWVLEAAPFEATAMLVAPLAAVLSLMEGSREEQAKKLLASVFNDSLYLVLSGFVMSSLFSKCQLDCRAAAFLQRRLGSRPFLFMLAIMFLGLVLSALVSNVTAPLLLVEVLKPLLRDMPTDSRYSRALLLGLAFSCNVGGMMTPISSPQNVASLQALRQKGGDISWAQWFGLSIPFCTIAILIAWLLLLAVYRFDISQDEASRNQQKQDDNSGSIPTVVFEKEDLSIGKIAGLVGATVTLCVFACAPVAEIFGGTSSVALLFVALTLGTGGISRQTFNAYSWHLMFLIGGGSALGLVVRESGLLAILTSMVRSQLASTPWLLVAELMVMIVAATTFVSHTVAALVLMPLVVELGHDAGVGQLAVLLGAFACSTACALPMTSFPNVNSLMAVDDLGKPWLSVKHFLVAGIPTTLTLACLLVTLGYRIGEIVLSPGARLSVDF
eukprot:TRINITY_DN48021_c0_g1_i1.p1 TRINITY_DN48021_c0_g1~~TRINITY_DN48021_c0_g1_i1.p1  ORF type:complete len:727 (+),score=132.17 TRINITY_DN48021_c0_g1_i1:42-2222(+)